MKNNIKVFLKSTPRHVWILGLIMLLGIFLRSYNFHDWLEFREDQVRDAFLSGSVAENQSEWPLLGPKMNYTGDSDQASFHLGPIYYYFQIISAKIFGSSPDIMAYPDLFFAICSIPLLYLFLRNLFNKELSLVLTGLYAVSGYFVHYSRFAWNTNLIPFFVLLFLLSIFKFLAHKEKTPWGWAIALGVAIGIGFQLHAIIMPLFLVVAFFVFLYTQKIAPNTWKKWAVVLLVFLILNTSQIFSEFRNNFANTKALFGFTPKNDPKNVELTKINLLENDLSCHTEISFLYLAYYGGTDCSYNITKIISLSDIKSLTNDRLYFIIWFVGIIFSAWGYWQLCSLSRKRNVEKTIYWRIILAYCIMFFLIMIPLSSQQFSDLRYLTPVFFIPFVFLGLLANLLKEKFPKYFVGIFILVMILLAILNIAGISNEVSGFISQEKTCTSHTITLGEIEPIASYLAANADRDGNIYFGGDKTLPVIYGPLKYLISKQNVNSIDVGIRSSYASDKLDPEKIGDRLPIYYLSCKSAMKDKYSYEKINNIYIFNVGK